MKRCNSCKQLKEVSEFYLTRTEKRDRMACCKDCKRAYGKKRYEENGELVRGQSNKYYKNNKQEIGEAHKKYCMGKGRLLVNKRGCEYAKSHPQKARATSLVHYYIDTGKMAKLACEVCGNFLSQAHHPDYDKPLDVIFLCHKHHMIVHHRWV